MIVLGLRGADVVFILGGGVAPETADDVDTVVTLADGSRWSASLMTIPAIERNMDRWKRTRQYLDGDFFQSADLVIMRQAGVPFATDLVQRMVDSGRLQQSFVRLEDDEDDEDEDS